MCTAGGENRIRRTGQDPRQSSSAVTVWLQALAMSCLLALGAANSAAGQQTPAETGAARESLAASGETAQDPDKNEGSVGAADTDQQARATGPPSISERWAKSLEALRSGIVQGTASAEDADRLFTQVNSELAARGADLAKALRWARSPDTQVEITPLEPARDAVVAEGAEEHAPSAPQVQETLASTAETLTLVELHAIVVTLYRTRIALLDYVTPAHRLQVSGPTFRGVPRAESGALVDLS